MTQWIKSGTVDQYIYFDAPPGLSSFTVWMSKNGASAVELPTPTVSEASSTNMPGVYKLLLDAVTTIAAGNITETLALYVSATGWSGKTLYVTIFDNLPADVNQVLGNDVAESGTGGKNIGYA